MKVTNKKELDEMIVELTRKKVQQKNQLIQQYRKTTDSFRPANLVKHAFKDLSHSPDVRNNVLSFAAELGVGLLTKNLLWGSSASLIKRIFGNTIKTGVTRAAISNTDKIKAYGTAIYNNIFKRKRTDDD
ncbi:MAG: hypothetical protein JST81_06380 [Bacteroidetes bacterium]|nr:hypothetical protein [Bacteroidota bacterium]